MNVPEELQVIPAVRGFKELERALDTDSDKVFLLKAEVIQLDRMVNLANVKNKTLYVHLDLLDGLQEDEAGLKFLSHGLNVRGVITTRKGTLLRAKKLGMRTVQRGFLLDSMSFATVVNTAAEAKPDYIELLPSFSYPMVPELRREVSAPIILGGFADKAADIRRLAQPGVIGISCTNQGLWRFSDRIVSAVGK